MDDVLKQFEEYLPKWSNEKKQPIPTREHMDRWYIAWNDFVNEELSKTYPQRRQEYLNMKFKTMDGTNVDGQVLEYVKEDDIIVDENTDNSTPVTSIQNNVQSKLDKVQALRKKNKQS